MFVELGNQVKIDDLLKGSLSNPAMMPVSLWLNMLREMKLPLLT